MKNVGVIGLGRMGFAVASRLLKANFNVFGIDTNEQLLQEFVVQGGIASDLKTMVAQCDIIWLMLPAGAIIDAILQEIASYNPKQLIVIDGGNSFYKDSIRRYEQLKTQHIDYLDCGSSGGLHAKELGFSLMIGGDPDVYKKAAQVFTAIACANGNAYMGPSGAGHYVKMVHNGIEYALLQAYAEGFALLKDGAYKNLDLEKIADVWMHGSIIRSWILSLTHDVLKRDQTLETISGRIGGGQTGRWTTQAAQEFNIPVPMIDLSLRVRDESQVTGGNYATKLVAMMRHEFGGHAYETID